MLRDYWRQEETLTSGEEASARYRRSLERLRRYPSEAALLLYDAYGKLGYGDGLAQHQVVSTLADLVSEHALAPLETIAQEPIPSTSEENDHHQPKLTHERIVRLAAVRGLAKLARVGSAGAEQALLGIARDPAYEPHASIRASAIRGFVGRGPEAVARAKLLEGDVPAGLRWALEPASYSASVVNNPKLQAHFALSRAASPP